MKKNIFILLVGLLSCQLTVFAQNPSVKTIDVEIKSDTTIVVRKLFGANCKLYGDIILLDADKTKDRASKDGKIKDTHPYTKYGGDNEQYFERYMKEANNGSEEYKNYVSRNNDSIVISLKYDNFPDTVLKLNFYGVLFDPVLVKNNDGSWNSSGYCRDLNNKYCVSIIKQTPVIPGTPVNPVNPVIPDTPVGLMELILILLFASIFIVLGWCINKLNKRINTFINTQKQSSLKSEDINIEQIKKAVISKTTADELVQRISNEDIYNVINRSDIQLYIQTVIAGKVDEYLRNNKIANPVPADINSGYNQQSPVVQPELRTTNVEYRADNNCFMVSENPEYRIFEVYSANGKYYYTIINDSAIRRNLLSIIAAFSKCIDHRLDSPIPTTVEVIKDGQLIKNGDVYIVDTNCILQVSLM